MKRLVILVSIKVAAGLALMAISSPLMAAFVDPGTFKKSQTKELVEFIAANAQEQWPENPKMLHYQYKHEMEDFNWLVDNATNKPLLAECVALWKELGYYGIIREEYQTAIYAKESLSNALIDELNE